jgi:hypothetical protein
MKEEGGRRKAERCGQRDGSGGMGVEGWEWRDESGGMRVEG